MMSQNTGERLWERRLVWVLLAAGAVGGCAVEDGTAEATLETGSLSSALGAGGAAGSENEDLTLEAASQSTPQSANIGSTFAEVLTVRLVDGDGHGVPNAVVTWAAPAVGPSADLDVLQGRTDDLGVTSVAATANGEPGAYRVYATVVGVMTPAVFELKNVEVGFEQTVDGQTGRSILAGGGGGCSAAAGGSLPEAGTVAMTLALAVAWLHARRRLRAGSGAALQVTLGAAALAAAALLPLPALAQQGFDANRYAATPLGSDGLVLQRPGTLRQGSFGGVLTFSYAKSPLMEKLVDANGKVTGERALIDNQLYSYLGVSYGVLDQLSLHLTLPVSLLQDGAAPTGALAGTSLSSAAIGDLRLGGRLHLLGSLIGDESYRGGLALDAAVILPTGDRAAFASDGKVRVQGSLVGELLPVDFLYLGANAGLLSRPGQELVGASAGAELLLSAGAGYRSARDALRLGVEANLQSRLTELEETSASASGVEALGVVGLRMLEGLHLSVGIGPGFSDGLGTPDFRAVARAGWALGATSGRAREAVASVEEPAMLEEPATEEVKPQPEPEPTAVAQAAHDRDGDGIADEFDACPDVPGISHTNARLHGCPQGEEIPALKGIGQQIVFDFGAARIRSELAPVIDTVAQLLRDHPEVRRVSVEGHTDAEGEAGFNYWLSLERAQAVVDALIAKGVSPSRLSAAGFGKSRPIADNSTEEGRSKNRRVEFRLIE